MLLAVDIGNSNIKFGIFDGEHLLSKHSLPTAAELTPDLNTSVLKDAPVISAAIICSVVPEKNESLTNAIREACGIDALIVSNDLEFGLKINYEPLTSLGTDRLVNSFAAVEKYGAPCVVCSLGKIITSSAA